jgi:hypothetical protein
VSKFDPAMSWGEKPYRAWPTRLPDSSNVVTLSVFGKIDTKTTALAGGPVHLSLRGHRDIGAQRSRALTGGNGFSDWSGNQALSNGLFAGQLARASNGVGFLSRCSD